jgi:hypothetical protein
MRSIPTTGTGQTLTVHQVLTGRQNSRAVIGGDGQVSIRCTGRVCSLTITTAGAARAYWTGWVAAVPMARRAFADEAPGRLLAVPSALAIAAVSLGDPAPLPEVAAVNPAGSPTGAPAVRVGFGRYAVTCCDWPAFGDQLAAAAMAYTYACRLWPRLPDIQQVADTATDTLVRARARRRLAARTGRHVPR